MFSPYRVIAKNALMSWNGLSEEEATKVVSESSFQELENQVWATTSIRSAVNAISTYLGVDAKSFEDAVLGQDSPDMTDSQISTLKSIAQKAKNVNVEELALYALACIHDSWVVDNAKKFVAPGREAKRYQHTPLETIGWNEAKADLLFLEPVLNSVGIEVNKQKLHEAYDESTVEFFKANGFIDSIGQINKEEISKKLMQGKDFYPALSDLNSTQSPEIANQVAEQVSEKVKDSLDKNKTIR